MVWFMFCWLVAFSKLRSSPRYDGNVFYSFVVVVVHISVKWLSACYTLWHWPEFGMSVFKILESVTQHNTCSYVLSFDFDFLIAIFHYVVIIKIFSDIESCNRSGKKIFVPISLFLFIHTKSVMSKLIPFLVCNFECKLFLLVWDSGYFPVFVRIL